MMAYRPVLFIDKVFCKRVKPAAPLRGVELFNLQLLRELAALDVPLSLMAVRSWRGRIAEAGLLTVADAIWAPDLAMPFLNATLGAGVALRRAYATLLVGNVGDGLLPAIRWLSTRRTLARVLLIAHRRPSPRFAAAFAGMNATILAVNGTIANDFTDQGCGSVQVDYGILNGDAFSPSADRVGHDSEIVHFCVLGALDNPWKGAEIAVSAFGGLPESVRARCRLHLAAYQTPPQFSDPHIQAYGWMPSSRMPDWLRCMDVMIVPSYDEDVIRETFSQATVQGMLTGLPVIHRDLPVLVEKFDAGGGIAFRDEAELTAAMARLAADSELRRLLGPQARTTARERYVWDTARFAERYLRN